MHFKLLIEAAAGSDNFCERERSRSLCRRLSVCRLSSVCNVRAPYSGD